ncbi:GGDEF domain-containing protein [Magnetospira sp. QH-2]|uniref:GGDEF domain-containing protein n=1 Tax=Magnetospira sp. (strain QH-2) TaxID=1288970 RepID=UPI0003E80C32|nr:GGDEF domain-containing protein [Magnetospira sp. QH-2]CCQ72262.1 putative Diguanylate cyclase [Magnetospira sp. QH-2]
MSSLLLKPLVPHVSGVFTTFYDSLLSSEIFAQHFSGPEQVGKLLAVQKRNFIASLDDDEQALFDRYYRLGILHYEKSIPFEAFLAGSKMLNRGFLEAMMSQHHDADTYLALNHFFESTSEALAKGYMDAFVDSNIDDLEQIKAAVQLTEVGYHRSLLLKHYDWLMSLFEAIKREDVSQVPVLDGGVQEIRGFVSERLPETEKAFWINRSESVISIYDRVLIHVRNIFFFLGRKSYTEALSLFVNLLEVYKFTLVFSNLVSTFATAKAQRQVEEILHLSEKDALTGAFNRRKFDQVTRLAVGEARDNGLDLSLIIIDIDHFKKVNDTHGHAAGDEALRNLVTLIRGTSRKGDLLMRYGGEEFVILCQNTNLEGAICSAENLLQRVESHDFPTIGRLTVSAGVATMTGDDTTATLFARADKCLYRAKDQGRNRVVSQ